MEVFVDFLFPDESRCQECFRGSRGRGTWAVGAFRAHSDFEKHLRKYHPERGMKFRCGVCGFIGEGGYPLKARCGVCGSDTGDEDDDNNDGDGGLQQGNHHHTPCHHQWDVEDDAAEHQPPTEKQRDRPHNTCGARHDDRVWSAVQHQSAAGNKEDPRGTPSLQRRGAEDQRGSTRLSGGPTFHPRGPPDEEEESRRRAGRADPTIYLHQERHRVHATADIPGTKGGTASAPRRNTITKRGGAHHQQRRPPPRPTKLPGRMRTAATTYAAVTAGATTATMQPSSGVPAARRGLRSTARATSLPPGGPTGGSLLPWEMPAPPAHNTRSRRAGSVSGQPITSAVAATLTTATTTTTMCGGPITTPRPLAGGRLTTTTFGPPAALPRAARTLPSIAEAESRAVSPARDPWSVVPQRTRRRHPCGSAPASTEENPSSSPAPSTTSSSGSSSVFEPPGDAASSGSDNNNNNRNNNINNTRPPATLRRGSRVRAPRVNAMPGTHARGNENNSNNNSNNNNNNSNCSVSRQRTPDTCSTDMEPRSQGRTRGGAIRRIGAQRAGGATGDGRPATSGRGCPPAGSQRRPNQPRQPPAPVGQSPRPADRSAMIHHAGNRVDEESVVRQREQLIGLAEAAVSWDDLEELAARVATFLQITGARTGAAGEERAAGRAGGRRGGRAGEATRGGSGRAGNRGSPGGERRGALPAGGTE
ncbi:mucin-5AC-like [Neodiprion fabricii]|uniref:mucin-5AC-like n=1 Tax=Neodiprion fabricii TaxID=2872261 RepID=UPI001ED917AE|nr:mucin-5AC-like [Neodiprion fabricii]